MDLHDRVMEILHGKAKMGAGGVGVGRGKKAGTKAGIRAKGKKAGTRAASCKPKNPKRVKSGKKAAKRNPWIDYVKAYALEYNISYKDALKKAGPSYRKQFA